METSRRAFLRTLLGGAAVVAAAPLVKPKSFFSFFGLGEIWKPKPAILPGNVLTLADFVRRMPVGESYAKISELLNERNSILDDLPWADEPSVLPGYRTTLRSLDEVAAEYGT